MPDRVGRQGTRTIQTRWLLAAVVVGVLSGCMVGPDYQRPALPSPAVFRDTAAPAAPPDPTSLGDLQWFEVFKDEQLQALIQTALVANYDLRHAVARVNEARAKEDRPRTSSPMRPPMSRPLPPPGPAMDRAPMSGERINRDCAEAITSMIAARRSAGVIAIRSLVAGITRCASASRRYWRGPDGRARCPPG